MVFFLCFLFFRRAGRTDRRTAICRKRALASITRQAPITAPSRRLSGAYQAPIRRLSGAYQAPTGPHPAPISDRQTDGLTDGQKHGDQKKNQNYTKIWCIFCVFLCFLFFRRAGRTDRRTRPEHTYLSEARAGVYHAPGAYHSA